MTRRFFAGLAAAALAVLAVPPGAHADAAATSAGECWLQTVNQDLVTGSQPEFVLYAAIAVFSTDPAANPVSATVTCQLRVNRITVATATRTGTGVVTVAGRRSFTANDTDEIGLCTTVDFADATPTAQWCAAAYRPPVPPSEVAETEATVMAEVWEVVDSRGCPLLAALAPSHGAVVVDDEGDVYVDGALTWDCPPFSDG